MEHPPPSPPHPPGQVWALAVGGSRQQLLASGGGDGALALWEDATAAEADAAAAERAAAALKEQELQLALASDQLDRAAALAFQMRHPGRLLAVVTRALARPPAQARALLARLAAGMRGEDLRAALEYAREWNTNARSALAAQSLLAELLRARRPAELLALPGVGSVLEGLVPYTQVWRIGPPPMPSPPTHTRAHPPPSRR